MSIALRMAGQQHLDQLLEYVKAFHQLEGIQQPTAKTRAAIQPLLQTIGSPPPASPPDIQQSPGHIWLIDLDDKPIGYIAVCFGYSIEFGGRDAFIDEMFIVPTQRGQGYGTAALEVLKSEVTAMDISALHLEVDRCNQNAQRLYRAAGFSLRDRYSLMSVQLKNDL